MAQGHRFKSEWPSEGLSGAPRRHSGRLDRFAQSSRNDGVDGAPNGISVPIRSLSNPI